MSGGTVVSLPEGLLDGGVWFRVEAAGTAAAVRRTAERLATELLAQCRCDHDGHGDSVVWSRREAGAG